MKNSILAAVLGLACSAAICSPRRPALVVSDAELADISADDRTLLDTRTAALRTARNARTTQKSALAAVEREVKIAALAISRDEAALAIRELEFQAAQETQHADTMLPAKKAREEAGAELDQSLAARRYYEAKRDYWERLVTIGEAEIPVADASLELARYEAATRSKGAPDAERLAELKSQVAAAEAELAEVQVAAARAKTAMEAVRPQELPAEAAVPSIPGTAEVTPAAPPEASPQP